MSRVQAALDAWIRAEHAYQAAQDTANKKKGERDVALRNLRLAKEQEDLGQIEIPFDRRSYDDVP